MVPSGPPNPVGGTQTVAPSALLRTNSSLLGGQGGSVPAQPAFSSLVSPRSQYGNMGVLGNLSNVSSLLGGGGNAGIGVSPSFVGANGPVSSGSNPGLSGPGNIQRGGIGMNAESDALTGIGSGLGFNPSSLSFTSTNASGALSSGLSGSMMASGGPHFPNSNNQLSQDLPHPQQLEVQNFQHGQQGQESSNSLQIQPQHMLGARSLQQFSAQNNVGLAASQQQQLQSLRALSGDPNGPQSLAPLRGLMPVKMEPQVANDQSVQQHMQALRGIVPVKLEQQQQQQQQHQHQQQQQQQITSLRNIPGIKSEPQHSDQSLLLQQQQQQQQLLQISRQSPQQMQLQAAQMNLLQQQQRLLQQQQQQQMFKTLPVQRSALQQQPMQQFQQHNISIRSAIKPMYEPGMCARRLTQYMYHQQHRPADNSIEFWRKFVSEYFAPHAKKRWCVSLYGNGRQTTGVFPQDVWHCEICNIKPGRGFETTVEVLPRLCKIKYDSGTLEELLYVDMPREYHTPSGHIVLDYGKAIQESVFEQLRVVRDGQLRVVFSMDLKICSWEFCARRHEELIPRRLILSQVSQLGAVAQKYQTSTQNGSSSLTSQELQNTCNMFVASARHLAKAIEVPLVNDLGYTKRYVRCLQISEVVNSMKDLIDYSRELSTGPMASLINFPRRTTASGGTNQCQQQQQQQQQEEQARSQNEGSVQASSVQQLTQGNGVVGLTNLLNASPTSSSASTSTIAGLIHQNAMNTRQDNQLNNGVSPFGNSVPISSAGSSNSLQQSHPNPSSPFPNTVPSAPNPLPQSSIPPTAHSSSANSPANIPPPQPSHSGEVDPDDSQSSVQQIIQEIMMSSQLNAGGNMVGIGPMGNEMKSLNTMNMQTGNTSLKGANCLVGNGISSSMGINSVGFGSMGGINSMAAATMAGIRTPVPGNSVQSLNGRISMQSMPHQDPSLNHQQDMSNRLLSGLGSVNNFNNLQFDWKPSP